MLKKTVTAISLAAFMTLPVISLAGSGGSVAVMKDGKATFEKKCRTCHSLERSLTRQKSREEWKESVKRMVAYGASLNSAQRDNVTAYLSARSLFGENCGACHEPSRVISDSGAKVDWRKTLGRMSDHLMEKDKGKTGLAEEVIEEISALLEAIVPEE